jgi:large subunit ribosomal protein L18
MLKKQLLRIRRHKRVRTKVHGSAHCPRLVVFRSLQHIEVQILDDDKGQTLVASNDKRLKGNKTARATAVGKDIATKAQTKKITAVVFDRNGYKYHGRIKALAEAARQGGLKF